MNVEALEETLATMRGDGRLSEADAAVVAMAQGLAEAVDDDPPNAALWREYRAALVALAAIGSGDVDDDSQAFLVTVSTPMGDGADAEPADLRAGARRDRQGARAAAHAVATGGRKRRS